MSKKEYIDELSAVFDKLSSLTNEEIGLFIDYLKGIREGKAEESVPLSIFNNGVLGSLEAIVKYLKEERKLDYSRIASLLGRKAGPIGITYRNAKRKLHEKLDASGKQFIPLAIFSDKKHSILESLALHLHDTLKMDFKEIALLLRRSYVTIWTTYRRGKQK